MNSQFPHIEETCKLNECVMEFLGDKCGLVEPSGGIYKQKIKCDC